MKAASASKKKGVLKKTRNSRTIWNYHITVSYTHLSGAAGIVPAILWLTGTVRITWPSVICVGLSVLYLIGLFFFRGKDFMREMQKKFRV